MRRLVVLFFLAALAFPAAAVAHPLGNFTVNRAAEITVSGDRIYLRHVLDLAEIPAFQEGDRLRRADLRGGLVLRVDGRRAPLRLVARVARKRPGSGGLQTMRIEALYDAGAAGRRLSFRDETLAGRIGWREIVVRAERGAAVRSAAPATSPSRLLRAYPRDLLRRPLDVRAAEATVVPGTLPGIAPSLDAAPPAVRQPGGFEGLVSQDLTPGFVFVALALALFWGSAHALGPGHGKAIVAGYLVGTRGTPRHAVLLGLIVTVTHTIGVFALGLVTLALSEFFLPEQLYPWLNLVSALLVLAVGAGILRSRVLHARAHARGHHHHHHHHDHSRGLLGAGISGGIVPCPTALVVLLAAISLHRVGFGLLLIVAFSLGLAATVTGIGLLAVAARGALARFDSRVLRVLPAASAAVVLALGVAMTVRALPPLL